MSKPPAPPSLQELRKEIDAIDEQVHRLLMARGDIIDRLIQVKQTQEVGSAFRPAREASMMRELVRRHRGILPLDTIESIWRVIISTFTYVQAPFSVHADVSVSEPAMRDSARFHFGFVVPYVAHFSAQAAVEAVAKLKEQPGKDFGVLGSGQLVRSLMQRGLVDDFVLMIHPLVLGTGRRLFADGGAFAELELTDTTTTTTGVVIATYRAAPHSEG